MFSSAGSAPLGSLAGIPVRLHLTFLLVLFVQCLGAIYYGWWAVLLWFVLLGPVLLVTVLVHELGHALAARYVGGDCSLILLWPLGGLAFLGHSAGPRADVFVAAAGPATHVPMVLVWLAGLAAATYSATGTASLPVWHPPYLETASGFGVMLCANAVLMNVFLFAFNLLVPAYPLDGGRILVGALLAAGVEDATVAKVALAVSVPLAAGVLVWGAVTFQMVTILVSVFIGASCYQLFDCLRKDTLRHHPLFLYESIGVGGARHGAADEASRYHQVGESKI
mmetsp:Transcript_30775/g.91454  ORF Transcript_30775/g.91454 Transcript_30775/m.91454 type:complete len:281 (-) Transcript_30775:267-1109(-)